MWEREGFCLSWPPYETISKGRLETEPALWMMGLKVAPHQALHLLSVMWVMAKSASPKARLIGVGRSWLTFCQTHSGRAGERGKWTQMTAPCWTGQPTHFFTRRSSLEKSWETQSNQPGLGYIPQPAVSLPHFPLL